MSRGVFCFGSLRIFLSALYRTPHARESDEKPEELPSGAVVEFTVHKKKRPEEYRENG